MIPHIRSERFAPRPRARSTGAVARRWISIGLGVLAALGLAGAAGYRIYRGDPVRTFWCRLAPCGELDGYDALCRAASIAELSAPACPAADLPAIAAEDPDATPVRAALADAFAAPPSGRYAPLEEAARAAGAPDWKCPPLARVLTSTCAP